MSANAKPRLSQKRALQKALKDLAPDVTAEDRKLAIKDLGLSKSTITTYLQGNVYDLSTGVKILKIIREQIQKRNEIINA